MKDNNNHKAIIHEMMDKKYLSFKLKGRVCYIAEDLFVIISGLRDEYTRSHVKASQKLANELLKNDKFRRAYDKAIKEKRNEQDIFKEVILHGSKPE